MERKTLVWAMTDQEKVQEIYPDSFASYFSFGGQLLCRIRTSTKELAQGYTEEDTWNRAWNYIQQEMLRKFER